MTYQTHYRNRKPATGRDPHTAVYFRLLKNYCQQLDLPNTTPTRHDVTQQALGRTKSSKQFTQQDWDLVLGFLRWRIAGVAGEWDAAKRIILSTAGERRRLLWRMRHEIPAPYLAEIAQDKIGHTRYDDMTLPELRQLRLTAIERKRTADRQGRNLEETNNAR
jgi:hypothetical protein